MLNISYSPETSYRSRSNNPGFPQEEWVTGILEELLRNVLEVDRVSQRINCDEHGHDLPKYTFRKNLLSLLLGLVSSNIIQLPAPMETALAAHTKLPHPSSYTPRSDSHTMTDQGLDIPS